MKKIFLIVIPLTVFFMMQAQNATAQESKGTVEIVVSEDTAICSSGTSTVDRTFVCTDVKANVVATVTEINNCWWDIYTWNSICAYVDIYVDGFKVNTLTLGIYNPGPVFYPVSLAMTKEGSHTIKADMQALMIETCGTQGGCPKPGGIMDQDSKTLTLTDDPDCCTRGCCVQGECSGGQ